MKMDETLLEIKTYNKEGYRPVIDYDSWRVAILNYCDELLPENITKLQRHDETDEVFVLLKGKCILFLNITKLQRHDETDEVFVLLKGKCILFLGEGEEEISEIYTQSMEPFKLYNVKKSVWHSHTLSEDAMVLIVENKDTTDANSPEIELSKSQRKKLIELTDNLI